MVRFRLVGWYNGCVCTGQPDQREAMMNNGNETPMQRRRFLKLVSTSAVVAPLAALAACTGGEEPRDSGSTEPAAEPATPESATESSTAESPAGDMPRLEESDPQARSLGYVHDATSVDTSRYPQYAAGQECANCALYVGEDGDEWGGCSIFPRKLVNARGWCSVWAPKA
jgi:hypothetical protein